MSAASIAAHVLVMTRGSAPAMLSLTTTLTESAAKTYVDKVVEALQQEQYAAVESLFDDALGQTLSGYASDSGLLQFPELSVAGIKTAIKLSTNTDL